MAQKSVSLLFFVTIQLFLINFGNCQNTYKAAVVEYSPVENGDVPENIILQNAVKYVQFMEQAKSEGVQIIVFPEYGLTGLSTSSNLEQFSTVIPDPSDNVTPYENGAEYPKVLRDLSGAAKTNAIYVVVNLLEKTIKAGKSVYYNTNIVFDKTGKIVSKYRKINLFDEDGLEPGNQTVTFQTDFGVTFGMFICFDIMFKNPALDVLKNEQVTDIIYPTAWFSESPFLAAISVHSGFARANGVNLLSSNYNKPSIGAGGSGIYFHNGDIGESYVSFTESSKMTVVSVPIIAKKTPPTSNTLTPTPRGFIGGQKPGSEHFKLLRDEMKDFTFADLGNDLNVTKTLCSKGSSYCCTFEVNREHVTAKPVYKLAAFYGVRKFGEKATGGIRVCALVACETDDSSTCGKQITDAGDMTKFRSVVINGTFFNSDTTFDFPTTLTPKIEPISSNLYDFYTVENNDKIDVRMSAYGSIKDVSSFGIYGRVYDNDGKEPGRRSGAASIVSTFSLIILGITLLRI